MNKDLVFISDICLAHYFHDFFLTRKPVQQHHLLFSKPFPVSRDLNERVFPLLGPVPHGCPALAECFDPVPCILVQNCVFHVHLKNDVHHGMVWKVLHELLFDNKRCFVSQKYRLRAVPPFPSCDRVPSAGSPVLPLVPFSARPVLPRSEGLLAAWLIFISRPFIWNTYFASYSGCQKLCFRSDTTGSRRSLSPSARTSGRIEKHLPPSTSFLMYVWDLCYLTVLQSDLVKAETAVSDLINDQYKIGVNQWQFAGKVFSEQLGSTIYTQFLRFDILYSVANVHKLWKCRKIIYIFFFKRFPQGKALLDNVASVSRVNGLVTFKLNQYDKQSLSEEKRKVERPAHYLFPRL